MEYRNANMIKKMTGIYHSDINFRIIVAIFEKIQITIEKMWSMEEAPRARSFNTNQL